MSAELPRRIAIVPAYNEELNIGRVVDELRAFDSQLDVVVVSDGSVDGTADVAAAHGAHVVQLPFNLGIGGAVQTGFKYAHDNGYELVVRCDGDGQHDPSELPKVLAPVLAGEADIAVGSRFAGGTGYRPSRSRLIGIRILAWTVSRLAANSFSFAGQSCISVQRIFVMDGAWDDFVPRFVEEVGALKVGDPADAATDVGPLITEDERERVLAWIRESKGEVLAGGDVTDDGLLRPTVIAGPARDDKVQCEEVFGPVVTLTRTTDLDDAIEQANATRYGLQAAIFTGDIHPALEAAKRLEFGGVTINEAPTFRADQMPYGGVKASGNTKEGPAWAVREMTEERLVVVQT